MTFHLTIDEITLVNIAVALGQLSLTRYDALLEVSLVQVARLVEEVSSLALEQAIFKVPFVSTAIW